jgi:hypothetical protein
MQLLNEYNQKRQELFDYFGYVENWGASPIDDATMYYWHLSGESFGDEGYANEVLFADTLEKLKSQDGNFYSNEIYTHRHLPKWVYRGADYTMVVVDTHTDGNKFLQIFDNSKEVKE